MSGSETRYSAAQRENAYQTYRTGAKRSLRQTAEITGIPYGTLGSWSRIDGWQLRLRDDDDRDIAIIRRHTEMVLEAKQEEAVQRMWDLAAQDDDRRIAFEALRWVLGCLGYAPITKGELAVRQSAPPQLRPDLAALSTEELAKRVHAELLPPATEPPEEPTTG